MKKQLHQFLSAAILAPMIVFTACEKDDPAPEIPPEEFDALTVRFTEVEMHGDHHHELEDPEIAEIKFRYENGQVVIDGEDHLHLTEGKTYLQEIVILDDGEEINDRFEPGLHQFFFTGAPEGVLDYVYLDEDEQGKSVGFRGYMNVLSATDSGFDLKIALIGFIRAEDKPSIAWNDPDYAGKIGGSGQHAFEGSFDLHPVEGEHDHEHHQVTVVTR